MYSQCPECQARFRVSADALRVAQGTVRCGRCGSAFNALAHLTDIVPGRGTDAASSSGAGSELDHGEAGVVDDDDKSPGQPGESHVAEFSFSVDDIERVFVKARDWQRQFGTTSMPGPAGGAREHVAQEQFTTPSGDEEEDGSSTGSTQASVLVDEPGRVEDITLEGERIHIEGLPDFFRESTDETEAGDAAPYAGDAGDEPEATRGAEVAKAGGTRPRTDLDSTDRFDVVTNVPDSAYPDDADEDDVDDFESGAPARVQGDSDARPATVEGTRTDAPARTVDPSPALPRAPAGARSPQRTARGVTGPAVIALAASGSAAATAPVPAPPVPAPESGPARARPTAGRWNTPVRADRDRLPFDEVDDEEEASVRRRRVLWALGAMLLALALSAQVMHFYRQDLVRDPSLGAVLRGIYDRLGLPLAPDWDLAAFELRQWGTSDTTPTAGEMTVRSSIRNGAAFAQPLPLLRLELEDRFGETVARRDFQPREYLKDPAQATRMLAPNAATEAELVIADTVKDAVGYRLDVCLQDPKLGILCALGSAPR